MIYMNEDAMMKPIILYANFKFNFKMMQTLLSSILFYFF